MMACHLKLFTEKEKNIWNKKNKKSFTGIKNKSGLLGSLPGNYHLAFIFKQYLYEKDFYIHNRGSVYTCSDG
jgi:effector-binding domain-containing protein